MAAAVIDPQRASPAGRWRGDDFPCWLPPMLVKELRQGVQSGVFLWTFLVFQAALFLIFSLQVLMVESSPGAVQGFTAFFWAAAVAGVAVLVPLRGLTAIGGERQGNALDLLQITRLSATRIVVGKWVALVAQSCLVAATLLPYLAIRYFFGGVDVLADLQWLGWILAAAAVVAAAAIAVSTLPVWLRIGVGIALCGAGLFALAVILDGPLGRSLAGGWGWQAQAGLLAALAVYTLACLEFATARIAPPAENHALRQRLLALVVAAAWPLVGWLGTREAAGVTFVATAPLLVAVAVGTLVDRPSRVRTLLAGFRRAGRAGRVAATVFSPGWASGLVFLSLVAAAGVAGWLGFVTRFLPADVRPIVIALAALAAAAIICPLPVIVLFSRVRYPLLLYGLVQLLCFTVFVFANAFKRYAVPWADYEVGRLVTLPFPLGAACALVATSRTVVMRDVAPTFTTAALAVIGVVLAVVFRPWLLELATGGRLVRGDALAAARPAAVARPRRASAAAARPWTWRGDDFPSWLSPMLVRELRQGVQSGIFAWTFIGIQGTMFALMTWAVGTFGGSLEGAYARDFAGMFWAAIALAIVVVVPLRGLTAVSGERVASNLDLVRLTRLSATRIILGKWAALVGQGLLVATALLPYLVLRYFFGGVNVIIDLEIFGWMVAGSMAVAAAALALSTLPLWARIGSVAVVGILGFVPAVELLEKVFRGRLTFASLGAGGRLGILAGLVVATVALLEYAAARIAPPAENHAGRMRLVAVGLAAAWAAVGVVGSAEAFVVTLFAAGPLLLCYAIGALLEQPVPIAALHRPFGRWGTPGRLAAALFTPGWATAVPFVAVLAGLCLTGWMAFFAQQNPNHFLAGLTLGCLWAAAVIFPLPVLVRWPRARPRLLLYGLVQLACFLLFVYLLAVNPRDRSWVDAGWWILTLPFPLAAIPAFSARGGMDKMSLLAPVFLTAAAFTTLVVLCLVARPWLAEMRRTLRLTRDARTHAGPQPPPPAGP
jgi:hypothetical protein